jgi:hypothetical protein
MIMVLLVLLANANIIHLKQILPVYVDSGA